MTRFVPTTIEEMRFMIAAPWGRGSECFDQAMRRPIDSANGRLRRSAAGGWPRGVRAKMPL